jgi:hypothetical protein
MQDQYTYEILIGSYTLENWIGQEGRYFYIEPSARNRTRSFVIKIRQISEPSNDAPWGLFDFLQSFWD